MQWKVEKSKYLSVNFAINFSAHPGESKCVERFFLAQLWTPLTLTNECRWWNVRRLRSNVLIRCRKKNKNSISLHFSSPPNFTHQGDTIAYGKSVFIPDSSFHGDNPETVTPRTLKRRVLESKIFLNFAQACILQPHSFWRSTQEQTVNFPSLFTN